MNSKSFCCISAHNPQPLVLIFIQLFIVLYDEILFYSVTLFLMLIFIIAILSLVPIKNSHSVG